MYEKHKKIYKIKPICPSMCPPKPSKPHQIRKEYYPPKPRVVGCGSPVETSAKQKHRPSWQARPSPSAPAKNNNGCRKVSVFLVVCLEVIYSVLRVVKKLKSTVFSMYKYYFIEFLLKKQIQGKCLS